ncbi:MAG: polyprenyl synthetase family protein [Candidatus Hodarchaeaceae archaeon]|nr:polyprenyl synthetase family protein [Candidatus Hodarchaeaceae archaeon]
MADEYERAADEVRKLFQERGGKILEDLTASILGEKIECDETKEALSHFASYWRDLVRPSLVSLACEAVGGDPSVVAPIGKSLSLLSGATDVHDDIIDRTMTKEKRNTVLGGFGGDIALLAGDALIFKGFAEFFEGLMKLEIPPEKKSAVVRAVKELYFEMCDGEALELRFRARTDVEPEEYLRVVRKKAADIEALTRVGAMLGGGSEEQTKTLGEYGRLLGMIVLLRNDLEDLLNFDAVDSRITNESLPLPILYALKNDEKKAGILAILKNGEVKGAEAERLLKLVSEAGGLDKLWEMFRGLKAQANKKVGNKKIFKTILEATVPESPEI